MVVASVRILSLVYTVWNLIIVSGGVLAEDLQLEGDLTREPENGLLQKDQVMKCLQNGEVPADLKWYTVKDEEEELITSGKYLLKNIGENSTKISTLFKKSSKV